MTDFEPSYCPLCGDDLGEWDSFGSCAECPTHGEIHIEVWQHNPFRHS